MAMASPAIGQYPYPLILEKEQQRFLQSLSANERKKILKRSAANDLKPLPQPRRRHPPEPAQQQQQPHAQGGSMAQWGEGGGPGGDEPLDRKAAPERDATCAPAAVWRHHLGRAAGPEAQPRTDEFLDGVPLAPADDGLALGAPATPREAPASPGLAAKPARSGLPHHPHPQHHHRLRLRSAAPRLMPDVRTIFEQPRDPRVREEKGEGHRFEAVALWRGWCDLCGEAVQQRALRCANCKYTCHQECRSLIQLDCSQQEGQTRSKPSPENTLTQNYSQVLPS